MGRKLTVEMVLDPDKPAAQQIIDHVLKMVALNVYRPGDDLPSALALADHLGIDRKIVQTAYQSLGIRGVTAAVRGGATFIAQDADTRQSFARRVFSDAIALLRNLVPPLKRDELRAAYLEEEERHLRSRKRPATESGEPD